MEGEILKALAPYGLPGIFLFVVGYLYHKKDQDLQSEKAARVKDAQDFLKLAMSIQEQVIQAVHKLGEVVDAWEKREQEREIRDIAAGKRGA